MTRPCLALAIACAICIGAWAQPLPLPVPGTGSIPGTDPVPGTDPAADPSTFGDSLLDLPEAFRDQALIIAVVTTASGSPTPSSSIASDPDPWRASTLKYTIPGSAVILRLVGQDLVILVQLTPYVRDTAITLVTLGQIWIKDPSGRVSYHSSLNSFTIRLGQVLMFYPLGKEASGASPLSLRISVHHASEGAALEKAFLVPGAPAGQTTP